MDKKNLIRLFAFSAVLLVVTGLVRANISDKYQLFEPAPALGDFSVEAPGQAISWLDLMGRWTLLAIVDEPPTAEQLRDWQRLGRGELGAIPQPLVMVIAQVGAKQSRVEEGVLLTGIEPSMLEVLLPKEQSIETPSVMFVDALVRLRAVFPADTSAQLLQAKSEELYRRYKDECCVSGEPTRIEILGQK